MGGDGRKCFPTTVGFIMRGGGGEAGVRRGELKVKRQNKEVVSQELLLPEPSLCTAEWI